MTWPCEVCKRVREDHLITTASETGVMGHTPGGLPVIAKASVRHCTDSRTCEREARIMAVHRLESLLRAGESSGHLS